MPATVQAACPGCRHLLRIPVDWADRPLRCKKCGMVVQAKKREPAAVPAADPDAPEPVSEFLPVANGYAQPADPFALAPSAGDGELPVPTAGRRRYQRDRGAGRFVGIALVLVLCLGVAGGGVVLQKYIQRQMPQKQPVANKGGPPDKHGNPGPTPPTTGKGTPTLVTAGDPFPRRLLVVQVSNYVYFNPLSPGSVGGKDAATKTAEKMAFELRVPTGKENNQLFVLSDAAGGKEFRPPVKDVIRHAYEQFFATSREQDRVVVYFGGHAVAADGKAYLVPVEGEPGNPETYLPLADFYAKLAACKAQQKVVLFDVCRLDPGRGEEKPGGEKMTEELSKLLLAAPPGVVAAVSCSPGQNAGEGPESGSAFLAAYRDVTEKIKRAGKLTVPKPEDPIPATQLLDGMKAALAGFQTVKVTGADPAGPGQYAKDAPPAPRFDWPAMPPGVSADEVVDILRQVNLPGIKADLSVPADLPRVYPFPEAVMKDYKADGVTDEDIKKNAEKYPVRKAALTALDKINTAWKIGAGGDGKVGLMEEFDGDVDDKLKKNIQNQQVPVARMTLELDEAIAGLEEAAKELDKEKSKRWRAVFQYAHAQALLRRVFLEEYNGALGKIRTDSLPKPEGGGKAALRLVSVAKTSPKLKERAAAAKELLETLTTEHKGTPYEVIAKLHQHISVGLEWRPVVKAAPMAAAAEDEAK